MMDVRGEVLLAAALCSCSLLGSALILKESIRGSHFGALKLRIPVWVGICGVVFSISSFSGVFYLLYF